jgi:hypothetical protein
MNLEETNYFLGWLSQHDGRVANSVAAVEIWQASLANATPAEAKQAVLDHYRGNEEVTATPGGIRKRTQTLRTTAEAKASAIAALPPVKHPNSWRARNPEEWDRLFAEGQEQRRQELARR